MKEIMVSRVRVSLLVLVPGLAAAGMVMADEMPAWLRVGAQAESCRPEGNVDVQLPACTFFGNGMRGMALQESLGAPPVPAIPPAVSPDRPSRPKLASPPQHRLIDLASTEVTAPSSVSVCLSYINRDGGQGAVSNVVKYQLETGAADVRIGVGRGLEVAVLATKLASCFTTTAAQTPFPVSDAAIIASLGVMRAGQIGSGEWRYAAGARKGTDGSTPRKLVHPGDSSYLDAFVGSISRSLGDSVEATVGAEQAYLPDATDKESSELRTLGLGVRYRPWPKVTLSLEGIHQDLPAGNISGALVVAGANETSYVNAGVRTLVGPFALDLYTRRLGQDDFREVDAAISTSF